MISQIHVSLRKKCKGKKRKNCEVKSFNVGSLTRGHKIQCPAKERNFNFHLYYIVMSPVLVQFWRGRQSGPDLTQVPRALPEQIQLSVETPGWSCEGWEVRGEVGTIIVLVQATGCQFNIICNDLYTKPACQGPTWRPLTKCEGDYLRFHSANIKMEVALSHNCRV